MARFPQQFDLGWQHDSVRLGHRDLVDSGNPQNFIYGARPASSVLTNAQTIQGTGTIGSNSMALNNTGTIDADYADHGLVIYTSNGTTNTGTLEATNGGTLRCRAIFLTMSAAPSRP